MSDCRDKFSVKNNCQLFKENLIVYINEDESLSISERMKRGYREMSKINLELSTQCMEDISDYETWLCGE